jgi:hypothetical protein
MATASSGLTPLLGAFPKNFSTILYTFGILVIPPTKRTSSILSFVIPASLIAFSQGLIVLFKKASVRASNLALVRFILQCFGPVASAVKYGKLISVEVVDESSILAFSAASLTLYKAILSLEISQFY